MGASASSDSAELLAARERLTAAQLVALEACFAERAVLDLAAFQACAGPGGALGARLFALLTATRDPAVSGVKLEALTVTKATLESGSDEDVAALGAQLVPQPEASTADVAALVRDLVQAAYPGSDERALAAAAQAIAAGAVDKASVPQEELATWLWQTPAAMRTLRGALAVPRGTPGSAVQLECRGTPSASLLLQPAWAWLLAPLLPPACQQTWTFLFSSDTHGASFSTLFGRTSGRGPVIVLMRDKAGAVAAGFADAPLIKRADFFGGYSCLLCALLPRTRVHKPTGNNMHMVWCAEGFSSVPNGLGFGGQKGHFGLFVDAHMETGHSRFSATYANAPLLGGAGDRTGAFELDTLEVWAASADAMAEAEEAAARAARRAAGGGSVLDRFAQDRNFLQTALDRGSASEGVR